jgi:hypothetical protein
MFIFFMILALALLVVGGIGLFHVNINVNSGTPIFLYANLIFGMFAFLGVAVLAFLAFFNAEFD